MTNDFDDFDEKDDDQVIDFGELDEQKKHGDFNPMNDPEVKEATENLFRVLTNKAAKAAQREMEGWPDELLVKRIKKSAMDGFAKAAIVAGEIIGVCKILDPSVSIDPLMQLHAEFQNAVLQALGIDGSYDTVDDVFDSEKKCIDAFIKSHREHQGCMLDEFQRRQDWPFDDDDDIIDDGGGEPC